MNIQEKLFSPKGFAALIYIAGVLILFWLWQTQGIETIRLWLQAIGPFAYLAYIILYLVCSLAFLPIAWLNVTAGILFGPWLGALFIMTATVLAASLSFFIGRHFLDQAWIQQKIAGQSALLEKTISKPHSWKTILALRLSNLAPFALINYLASTMELRFSSYLWATIAGSIPGTLMASGLGSLLYEFLNDIPQA